MAETSNGHVANLGRRILISLLGIAVVAIFGTAIFSYQVQSTEKAVVLTFGSISGVRDPGLHFPGTSELHRGKAAPGAALGRAQRGAPEARRATDRPQGRRSQSGLTVKRS